MVWILLSLLVVSATLPPGTSSRSASVVTSDVPKGSVPGVSKRTRHGSSSLPVPPRSVTTRSVSPWIGVTRFCAVAEMLLALWVSSYSSPNLPARPVV